MQNYFLRKPTKFLFIYWKLKKKKETNLTVGKFLNNKSKTAAQTPLTHTPKLKKKNALHKMIKFWEQ